MALGLTQPLAELSCMNISLGGKGDRCVGLTTLQTLFADCLKSGNLKLLETSGPVQASNGIALPFIRYTYCAGKIIKICVNFPSAVI